jgi:hypothetical protein
MQEHPTQTPIAIPPRRTCTWCAFPLREGDRTEYLSRLAYHGICLSTFEDWLHANADKLNIAGLKNGN